MPRDPGRALQILENYLRMRLSDGKSLALIIDFAETLAPGGEMAHLSAEDRFVLATLVKWAQRPAVPRRATCRSCCWWRTSRRSPPRISRNPYVAPASSCPCRTRRSGWTSCRCKLEGKQLPSISEVPLRGRWRR